MHIKMYEQTDEDNMETTYDLSILILRLLISVAILLLMWEFFSKPLLARLTAILEALYKLFDELALLVAGIQDLKDLLIAISGKLDITNQQLKDRVKSDNNNIN